MPSTNRSRTPANMPDQALFDCSKIIKTDGRKLSTGSKRHHTPASRVEPSSHSGGHRPYSSRGRERDETASNGPHMRGATSANSSKNSPAPKAPYTDSKTDSEKPIPRPQLLSEKKRSKPGTRTRTVFRRLWSFLRALILLGCTTAVCAAAYLMAELRAQMVTYCDTGMAAKNCTTCPGHGKCLDGMLHCDAGYEELRQTCVKDRNLESRSKLWLENLEHHLAYLQGMAKCYENETGMLDEHDVKQYLAKTYGGTYLEETFAHMKTILPVTIRRTGTVFDTTRVYIPITCRVEHAFWLYVPPVILCMFVVVLLHWLYTYRQRKNEAYALVKQFIENQTTVEPRLSGPTCADVTQYGSSIGIEETQCRAILQKITQKETSIRSSPDPFRGNALIYWSQRIASVSQLHRSR